MERLLSTLPILYNLSSLCLCTSCKPKVYLYRFLGCLWYRGLCEHTAKGVKARGRRGRVEVLDCEIQSIEAVGRVFKSDDEAWDTDMLIRKVMILIQSWIL
jgi:hypothetical protein